MPQPERHRKVDEDSPERCQAVNTQGQCNNAVVSGCNFCLIHGGAKQEKFNEKQDLKNYRLTKWRARVNEFADNPNVKSLREEVGLVRLQIEAVVNMCKDETDLLLYSERIAKLITQAQNLVLSCQKLEEKSGQTLDRTQLLVICDSIVKVIGDHVTDVEVLDVMATAIMDNMTKSIAISPLS